MFSTYSPKVSPLRRRQPDRMDSRRIREALEANLVSVREAPVAVLVDIDKAVEVIVNNVVDAVIVDEAYLVVYEIGIPWYSDKEVLLELLVLRIGEGSSFTAVTDTLDDLAYENDVVYTFVGSAFARSPRALSRLYSRQGFVDEGRPSLNKRRR